MNWCAWGLIGSLLLTAATGDAQPVYKCVAKGAVIYSHDGDYDPSPNLEKIQAPVLAINAADAERNPPETGIIDREMKRVKNGKLLLIPASDQTAGHGTTGSAKWYAKELGEWMRGVRAN